MTTNKNIQIKRNIFFDKEKLLLTTLHLFHIKPFNAISITLIGSMGFQQANSKASINKIYSLIKKIGYIIAQ